MRLKIKNSLNAGLRPSAKKRINVKSKNKIKDPRNNILNKPSDNTSDKLNQNNSITDKEIQNHSPYEPQNRKFFNFPSGYGDNRIVALVRDPWWIFAYWEIRKDKDDEISRKIESSGDERDRSVLRVYDITGVHFNGKNANSYFDIDLTGLATSWYINVALPGRTWVVDIGVMTKRGKFYLLARSNIVNTPRYGMSDQLDAEWMIPEDEYWKLFGLSGGFGIGKSSFEMKELIKKRLEEQITSGVVSSGASVHRKPEAVRNFWLVVNCELIVYGATEPDAKLTIQGKSVKLRPDGTFTVRYALPDGEQVIPVEAVSNDGIDQRRVTPIVTRRTE